MWSSDDAVVDIKMWTEVDRFKFAHIFSPRRYFIGLCEFLFPLSAFQCRRIPMHLWTVESGEV